MHISAPTLTFASKFSLGLRRTDLAGFLSTAPLAEFPFWLAMGGVPAVKTLGQLFRPRLRTDVLLILEGAQLRSVLRCTRTPPPFLRFSTGGDLIPLKTSKVQARILCSGGAARLSPLSQFTTFLLPPGEPLLPPSRLWRPPLLSLSPFPLTASLSRLSRRRMIISPHGI